jgi:hypothetical protein
MSCALANPVEGVCANKRPVQGRRAAVRRVDQPELTPLAAGHSVDAHPAAADTRAPFPADAPEATFSMAQLRQGQQPPASGTQLAPAARRVAGTPPSFREIRAGRVAAAARTPEAAVRIPVEELETGTLVADASSHAPAATAMMLPGMDQLVERVRQRTAARLSRVGASRPA